MSRRSLLGVLLTPGVEAVAQKLPALPNQGMSSRGLKPGARGKGSGKPFHSRLTDIGRAAGLKTTTLSGHPMRADYVIEAMGGGCAFFDFDNDGWLDILILTGSRNGDPPADASNRLYKNNRDGTFADVTEKAGLFRIGYFYGVAVGDYDNDGFEDLFLTGYPQNVLYRNNGNGTFTDVTKQAGLLSAEARFGSGCTFIDYDRDGKLDLFVSNYVLFDQKSVPRAGELSSCNLEKVFCGPRGLPYGRHSLYRNNGDGTFTDVTVAAGIDKPNAGYGLTAVAADFDNDGWTDIYVACDSTPSLLFRNQHDGTFVEQAMERGVALSDDGMEQAGMGIAVGDLATDGNLDIVKTHFAADTPVVYTNNGKGEFRDDTLRSGLAAETRFISWGVGVEDLDNDGNPDIFWVTGGIYPEMQNRPDQPYRGPRIIFRSLGNGHFEELDAETGAGVGATHCSRGCAFGDFDNDGDMDILVVNLNEPPSLLRNDVTGGHHWIKIKLIGTKSNRSAIGACVKVLSDGKIQVKGVLSQSSYLSVNDSRLHFGLGSSSGVGIEVRWPSGGVEKFTGVNSNQLVYITEGSGITRTQKLG
jgi:enediyne biosynthesis protein E4